MQNSLVNGGKGKNILVHHKKQLKIHIIKQQIYEQLKACLLCKFLNAWKATYSYLKQSVLERMMNKQYRSGLNTNQKYHLAWSGQYWSFSSRMFLLLAILKKMLKSNRLETSTIDHVAVVTV